jgi:hypothetical protein
MAQHTLIFIHGMGDTRPLDGFEALWSGIRDRYDRRPGKQDGDFDRQHQACFVDWHAVTVHAKRLLFDDAFQPLQPEDSLPGALAHPFAFGRTFFTFFLGDVVAYVDEGPNDIRTTVWKIMKQGLANGGPYSIVAHSLGSVIAFDFIYHLFEEGRLFDPVSDPDASVPELQARLRGLYTMGSPVGLFMLRNGTLWRGPQPFRAIKNPLPDGRVWQNFWDEEDLVAYPLGRLFATNPANDGKPLLDVPVGTGPDPVSAHIRYWYSRDVADHIARSLP